MKLTKRSTSTKRGNSPAEIAEIIDEQSMRLAGAAAVIRLAMDSTEPEVDALGIALDTIESANTRLAKIVSGVNAEAKP